MKILLTGGAGFIGSHTLIELTEAGHEAVVVDNLATALRFRPVCSSVRRGTCGQQKALPW